MAREAKWELDEDGDLVYATENENAYVFHTVLEEDQTEAWAALVQCVRDSQRLADREALAVDIDSTIHQHYGDDGMDDGHNDWVADLTSALMRLLTGEDT